MRSPRGVIEVSVVDYNGRELHVFKVEEAFGVPVTRQRQTELASKPTDEAFRIPGEPSRGLVQKAGDRLYKDLCTSPAARQLFYEMARIPTQGLPGEVQEVRPLFLKIDDDPRSEELPWEMLWDQQMNFLCLDERWRWSVARLAAQATPVQQIVRTIEPALRIVLVLGAAGVKGAKEWDGFHRMVRELRPDVRALILVSEDEARDQITADLATWEPERQQGQVEFIGDATSFMEQIIAFAPNIVHFFCHGSADARPELEVETRADRRSRPPKDRGSIRLDDTLLGGMAGLRSLWLVVLNCCKIGRPAPNLHSLAKTLVFAGAPAVVAMRESIDVIDANMFAENFYRSTLTHLKVVFDLRQADALPPERVPIELIWMRATDTARRQLSVFPPRVPDSNFEWTYPVLYVHRDDLKLESRRPTVTTLTPVQRTELAVKLQILRDVRNSLRAGRDPETERKRQLLNEQISAIDAQLAG